MAADVLQEGGSNIYAASKAVGGAIGGGVRAGREGLGALGEALVGDFESAGTIAGRKRGIALQAAWASMMNEKKDDEDDAAQTEENDETAGTGDDEPPRQKHGRPRKNTAQNRQAKQARKKAGLTDEAARRRAHDELTQMSKEGESLSYDELVEFYKSFVK